MLHKIGSQDWIVNWVIPGRPGAGRSKHLLAEFAGFEEVEALLAKVEARSLSRWTAEARVSTVFRKQCETVRKSLLMAHVGRI